MQRLRQLWLPPRPRPGPPMRVVLLRIGCRSMQGQPSRHPMRMAMLLWRTLRLSWTLCRRGRRDRRADHGVIRREGKGHLPCSERGQFCQLSFVCIRCIRRWPHVCGEFCGSIQHVSMLDILHGASRPGRSQALVDQTNSSALKSVVLIVQAGGLYFLYPGGHGAQHTIGLVEVVFSGSFQCSTQVRKTRLPSVGFPVRIPTWAPVSTYVM